MQQIQELNCLKNKNQKIVVNLNSKNSGLENFLRQDKLEQIAKLIKERIHDIESFKFDKNSSLDEEKQRYRTLKSHDSILIDGKRGSGKTTFLINLIECLNKTNDDLKVKVFELIDPAVIHSTTKNITDILLLLISKLFNNFDNYIRKNKYIENKENLIKDIYEKFEELNLIATEGLYFNEHHNIDRFSAMSKAITTDYLLHELFAKLIDFYDVKILILFIDDIDMEFQIAFDVIDIVRRYFASPYIIPILAFDSAQAYGIIKKNYLKHFDYKAKQDMEEINSNSELEFLQKLPREFMVKVFPPDRRIYLEDMLTVHDYYNKNSDYFLICYKRDNIEYKFKHLVILKAFLNVVYGFYNDNFFNLKISIIDYLESKSKRAYTNSHKQFNKLT